MHFFPGRDLAPPRHSGSSEASASASARAARARITRASAGGGGAAAARRVPLLDRVNFKRRSVAKGIPANGGGGKLNLTLPAAMTNFSSTMDAARRAAASTLRVRPRSSAEATEPPLSGYSGARVDREVHSDNGDDDPVGLKLLGQKEEAKGGGELATMDVGLRGEAPQAARRGTITPASNLGALLERATRIEEKEGVAREAEAGLHEERGKEEEREDENEEEEKDSEEEGVQPAPPALQSETAHHPEQSFGEKDNITASASTPSAPEQSPPQLPHSRAGPAPASPSSSGLAPRRQLHETGGHRQEAAATATAAAASWPEPSEPDDPSFVGDNFSTIQLQRQGGAVTVYVPRPSQAPGAWSASVAYDGERDVAWVLAEALRMYGTEHDPVARHAGLARRPRLVRRHPRRPPPTRWGGLFSRAEDADGGGGREWEPAVALSPTSPVVSVLTPGEELVVLVDGWEPELAFARRPSVMASPPFPRPGHDRTAGRRGSEAGEAAAGARAAAGAVRGHRGGVGLASACGSGEDDVRDACRRAPSDGAERFAGKGGEEGITAGHALGRLPWDRNVRGSGGGIGFTPNKGGPEAGVVETSGGHQGRGLPGVEHRGATGGIGYEAVGDEKDSRDSGDGAESDSSLTDEEEEVEEDGRGGGRGGRVYYRHQNHLYGRGGGAESRRGGGQEASATNDVSVTTKGLEQRCEEEEGEKEETGGGRRDEQRDEQRDAGAGYPEPRSPPRSLVSAMFSAWGNS